MRYAILGPLRIGTAATEVAVSAGRDRVVLALLLLRAGRPVAVDELVDELWPDGPPATARGQVQSCVSRLRRSLAAIGSADDLRTGPGGYLLAAPAGQLDAAEFDHLTTAARHAAAEHDLTTARDLYQRALDLWRGPALADIDTPAARAGAAALDERRYTAIEDRIDLDLHLGHHRELVSELSELVRQHPLRERFRGQLMTALTRAGRRADALAIYRQGRELFTEELGIEPGTHLRYLHNRILQDDPTDAHPTRDEPGVEPTSTVPRCLPRPVTDFTGRAESVRFLLTGAERTANGPVIHLIDGMPGSGKTALAVHVAHLLAADYPDAQLFIDLQGHGQRSALEPSAALVTLLRQLGVPSERIPADPDGRTTLWRSEMAHRRALILLDNAASTAQVRPLLPTTTGTIAIVTSRRRLIGLDGVRPQSLPVLDEQEAIDLLARMIGADRVTAEPEAAARITRRCGYLPLALRLAGARLAHRPAWRLTDLANRLDDQPLLHQLTAEDRTITGAFELSYHHLPPPHQRTFRLLALHPGDSFDTLAAAALTNTNTDDATRHLTRLVDDHLVEEPTAGRYRLHDLLREYATQLATTDPEGHLQPLGRLLDFYIHAASAAGKELRVTRTPELPDAPRPELVEAAAAGAATWLEQERTNLTRLAHTAHAHGLHLHAWRLGLHTSRYFYVKGYTDDLLSTNLVGLKSAAIEGDQTAIGWLHSYLGAAHFRSGALGAALGHTQQAVESGIRAGGQVAAANMRVGMSLILAMLGRFREALHESTLALHETRRAQDLAVLAHALNGRSEVLRMAGQTKAALTVARSYLILSRELRQLYRIGVALGNVGAVRAELGDLEQAERLLTVALAVKRRGGNRPGEAETTNQLAVVLRKRGQVDKALELHHQALRWTRELGNPHDECLVLNDLAHTCRAAGDLDEAITVHRRALDLARRHNYRYRQADAHDGLGRSFRHQRPVEARRHWEQALRIYRQLDIPRQHDVEEALRQLPHQRTDTDTRAAIAI